MLVTYEISYEKDGKIIWKRNIKDWNELNIALKWIKGKHFDTIKIHRKLILMDSKTDKIIYSSFYVTLMAYDSSPLRYKEYWDRVHINQLRELQDAE